VDERDYLGREYLFGNRAALDAIDPAKDVDGVTMRSSAAMDLGLLGFRSAKCCDPVLYRERLSPSPTSQPPPALT
jgi:hypothetical protein